MVSIWVSADEVKREAQVWIFWSSPARNRYTPATVAPVAAGAAGSSLQGVHCSSAQDAVIIKRPQWFGAAHRADEGRQLNLGVWLGNGHNLTPPKSENRCSRRLCASKVPALSNDAMT